MTTRVLFLSSMLLISGLISGVCCAQMSQPTSAIPQEIPTFDINAIDKTADPCVDFYQYACGTWMKSNPIPADKSRWGRFDQLYERNLYILRDLLNEAQAPGKHTAIQQMVGTYYGACMDESAIEKKRNRAADAATGADCGDQNERGFDPRDCAHAPQRHVGAVCVLLAA